MIINIQVKMWTTRIMEIVGLIGIPILSRMSTEMKVFKYSYSIPFHPLHRGF